MVLNTSYTLSIKNHSEKYDTYKFSLFDLSSVNKIHNIKKIELNSGYLLLSVECIYCYEIHNFKLPLRSEKGIFEIKGCRYFGFPILVFGEKEKVESYIYGQDCSKKQVCDKFM